MIVGFGLVNKDCVAVVPVWERDHKVRASHYFEQVGGPVPVALEAIARLGGFDCHHLGVVGDDTEGQLLATWLAEVGVTPHLTHAPGIATSKSLVFLEETDGSRTLANYAEALPPLVFTEEHDRLLQQAELVHLDARDLEGALHAARLAKAHGARISLDLGTMRPGREALFPLCDFLLASQGGGSGAFPECADDPFAQVRGFLRSGCAVAGVTLGNRGVVLATQAEPEPRLLPAFAIERVRDTCGAGDTFHGAFCWAMLSGFAPHAAADFAQAAVALRVSAYGNRTGLPTRAAVEAFLAQNPPRRFASPRR